MKKMSGQYTVTTNQPDLSACIAHVLCTTGTLLSKTSSRSFGTCRLCSTWTVLCFLSHS